MKGVGGQGIGEGVWRRWQRDHREGGDQRGRQAGMVRVGKGCAKHTTGKGHLDLWVFRHPRGMSGQDLPLTPPLNQPKQASPPVLLIPLPQLQPQLSVVPGATRHAQSASGPFGCVGVCIYF